MSTYKTKALTETVTSGSLSQEAIDALSRLEKYIVDGVDAFGGTSIVVQGRGVNATITRHWDLYIAMVRELKGEEEAQKTIAQGAPGFPVQLS